MQINEKICYKHNYLASVIARIDLLLPNPNLSNGLPKDVLDKINEYFPIPEPKTKIQQELQLSTRMIKRDTQKIVEWNFHGNEREKTFTVVPNAIFAKWTKYKSYEDFKNEFTQIAIMFFKHYKESHLNRIGIRAINEINITDDNPLDWKKYINNLLLHHFEFGPDIASFSRVFHNIEYNYKDYNFRFQFGMHNPDYPSIITKKIFILDFDAYYRGLFDPTQINDYCDKFHDKIQEYFELCITDELRTKMND